MSFQTQYSNSNNRISFDLENEDEFDEFEQDTWQTPRSNDMEARVWDDSWDENDSQPDEEMTNYLTSRTEYSHWVTFRIWLLSLCLFFISTNTLSIRSSSSYLFPLHLCFVFSVYHFLLPLNFLLDLFFSSSTFFHCLLFYIILEQSNLFENYF